MTIKRSLSQNSILDTENEMPCELVTGILEHPNIQLATYPDSEIIVVTLLSERVRETLVTVDIINK